MANGKKSGKASINVTNFAADENGRGLPPENYKTLGTIDDFLKAGEESYIKLNGKIIVDEKGNILKREVVDNDKIIINDKTGKLQTKKEETIIGE